MQRILSLLLAAALLLGLLARCGTERAESLPPAELENPDAASTAPAASTPPLPAPAAEPSEEPSSAPNRVLMIHKVTTR